MIPKFLLQFFSRLKFPWLFALTALIFGVDLMVPDFMPFADELLLGLSTLLLGAWKSRKAEGPARNESTALTDDSAAAIDER